jgi:hypothetical protein
MQVSTPAPARRQFRQQRVGRCTATARTSRAVLLAPDILSPHKDHRLGRAYGASHAMAQAPPQTLIFHGKTRRLSGERTKPDSAPTLFDEIVTAGHGWFETRCRRSQRPVI